MPGGAQSFVQSGTARIKQLSKTSVDSPAFVRIREQGAFHCEPYLLVNQNLGRELARHQPFETALFNNYGTKFLTVTALEEKFREYASDEFGTSLQQAGGG